MGKPHLVCLVDGSVVKLLYDMDFSEGSNYIRYGQYVPQGQMWVDVDLVCHQRKFKAYHEVMEVLHRLTDPNLDDEGGHQAALKDEKLMRLWDAAGRPSLS